MYSIFFLKLTISELIAVLLSSKHIPSTLPSFQSYQLYWVEGVEETLEEKGVGSDLCRVRGP